LRARHAVPLQNEILDPSRTRSRTRTSGNPPRAGCALRHDTRRIGVRNERRVSDSRRGGEGDKGGDGGGK